MAQYISGLYFKLEVARSEVKRVSRGLLLFKRWCGVMVKGVSCEARLYHLLVA